MGFSLHYLAHLAVFLALAGIAAYQAYNIRLYAIKVYGLVIHEFDPYFNYRTTKYPPFSLYFLVHHHSPTPT